MLRRKGVVQAAGLKTDAAMQVEEVTAMQLHQDMLDAALHSVTAGTLELHKRRGKPWQCLPDRYCCSKLFAEEIVWCT